MSLKLNFKTPETLRSLRFYLELSGYYRRFIKDYAKITKPLCKYFSGKNCHFGKKNPKMQKYLQCLVQ